MAITTKKDNSLLLIIAVFGAILSTIIILYAFLAVPVADDWLYYTYHTLGFSGYIEAAMNHTGRLLQWILVFIGYKFFGMALAVKIVPIALYVVFTASVWWFLQITRLASREWIVNVIIATLIASISLFLMPSVFDTYLWLTSSTVYLASMAALFVSVTLIYILLTRKMHWTVKGGALLLIAAGQTFSEPTSAFLIGATGLAILVAIIYKKWRYVSTLSMALLTLVVGFLVVYLSPGSASRRDSNISTDWSWVFIDSLESYGLLFQEWKLWIILGLVLFFALLFLIDTRMQKIKSVWFLVVAVGLFISMTYPVFALNNYTQNYIPLRVLSLPALGVVLAIASLALFTVRQWPSFIKNKNSIVVACVLVAIVVVLPTVFRVSAKTVSLLSIRYSISRHRDVSVSEQIAQETRPIVIERSPVFVRSNAADFYYGDGQWDKNGRNWVVNTYLQYKGISPDTLPVGSVILVDPPEFYTW